MYFIDKRIQVICDQLKAACACGQPGAAQLAV